MEIRTHPICMKTILPTETSLFECLPFFLCNQGHEPWPAASQTNALTL